MASEVWPESGCLWNFSHLFFTKKPKEKEVLEIFRFASKEITENRRKGRSSTTLLNVTSQRRQESLRLSASSSTCG